MLEINQELYTSMFTNINEGIKKVIMEIRPGKARNVLVK
jgi:hypothetical protein